MKREEAIINAGMCECYLATYHKAACLTKEITPNNVSVHYFDSTQDKEQLKKVVKELDSLRIVGSEVKFITYENLNVFTFTIFWEYE